MPKDLLACKLREKLPHDQHPVAGGRGRWGQPHEIYEGYQQRLQMSICMLVPKTLPNSKVSSRDQIYWLASKKRKSLGQNQLRSYGERMWHHFPWEWQRNRSVIYVIEQYSKIYALDKGDAAIYTDTTVPLQKLTPYTIWWSGCQPRKDYSKLPTGVSSLHGAHRKLVLI